MKILFVCLGNTCRSPMAEGIMRHLVAKRNLDWEVDSAGLRSWNVGYLPEDRCIRVLAENGIKIKHLGRELQEEDYHKFDYIFGMDEANLKELKERAPPNCKAKLELLGTYIGRKEDQIIGDPYFANGFLIKCCPPENGTDMGTMLNGSVWLDDEFIMMRRKFYIIIHDRVTSDEMFKDETALYDSSFSLKMNKKEKGIGGFRRCYDQIYPSLVNFLKLKSQSQDQSTSSE